MQGLLEKMNTTDSAPESPDRLPAQIRDLHRKTHLTIKKVTDDLEGDFHFNTAVSSVMELLNQIRSIDTENLDDPSERRVVVEAVRSAVILLSPFVPHICEELWRALGHATSVFNEPWPSYDPEAIVADMIEIPIQVNGRLRSRMNVPATIGDEEIRELAVSDERVRRHTEGLDVVKVIVVKRRLVNIVAK